jgi:hemoglobin
MNTNLTDILSRDDIVALLNKFYGKAQADEIIGDKFTHLNMAEHTQIIADFWDGILFGADNYKGDPFGKHLKLNLAAEDFDRWVELFDPTINDNFKGPAAEEAKVRAGTIAKVFKHKLGLS